MIVCADEETDPEEVEDMRWDGIRRCTRDLSHARKWLLEEATAVELGEAIDRCDSDGETKTRPKLRGRVREQQSARHSNRAITTALHI